MASEDDERISEMASSTQIMAKLIDKALNDRRRLAENKAARCLKCFDTGLDCGVLCVCQSGAKLRFGEL
jgi:hypothetical protein